jgi:aspartate aminotransferase-like enzyme
MGIFKGERIFTPGPVEVPERIREVLARQVIHHRTPEFREAFLETRDLFKRLVGSPSENFVFFTSSGTGAMEAAVLNFFKEGDKVVAVVGGKFGQRWSELARRWGLRVVDLNLEWGESVDPNRLEDLLRAHPDCRGVLLQMSESSTGAYHDVRAVARVTRDREVLLVVDAITALGVYNVDPEGWGLDVVVGGSQKAFMLPPGLSMLWFSERAKERLTGRSYYFNIPEELKKQVEGQTAWTPAISLVLGLRESLRILLGIGMSRVEEIYRTMAEGVREAAKVIGFSVFPREPTISLTALRPPEGLEADEVRRRLLGMGVRVAGGQGKLKGRILRISHMGHDPLDMVTVLSALEVAVSGLGLKVDLGSGVGVYMSKVRDLV